MEKLGYIQIRNVLFYSDLLEKFSLDKYSDERDLMARLRLETVGGVMAIGEFTKANSRANISAVNKEKLCTLFRKWNFYGLDQVTGRPEVSETARLRLSNAIGTCEPE